MGKKYSVHVVNGEVDFIEVDGVIYKHPDDIPNPGDRAKVLNLMARSKGEDFHQGSGRPFESKLDRELEKQSAKARVLMTSIFGIIALMTLSVAVLSGMSVFRSIAREKSAPGKVVDLIVRRSAGGYDSEGTYQAPQDYYYPVVEFYLPDETQETIELSEGSWPPAYQKGEDVMILYDPEKPIHARIQSTSGTLSLWILPIITCAVGTAFSIATVFVFWFLKPSSKKG